MIADAGLDRHAGVAVIGQWVAGRLISPPNPRMRLEPGGILVLVGGPEALRAFVERCEGAHRLSRTGPFVIGGGGVVGHKVAELLADAGETTLVIDRAPAPGVDLVGNMLDTKLLERAGIAEAQAVILAPSADSTAIFGTVIVKDLAPAVPVIARVNRAENVPRLYVAGADFALSVSEVSGQLLAFRLLGRESVAVSPGLRVARLPVHDLAGRHPRRNGGSEQTGCTVVAVERAGVVVVEFGDDFAIRADDVVYVVGTSDATRRLAGQASSGSDIAPAPPA
jgi:Trk K+ transport system NAD-binding subunit